MDVPVVRESINHRRQIVKNSARLGLTLVAAFALVAPGMAQGKGGGKGGGGGGGGSSNPAIVYIDGPNHGYLTVMDADGANKQRLLEYPIARPSWSSDGTELLFEIYPVSNVSDPDGIYAIGLDGTGFRQIVPKFGVTVTGAASSPVPAADGTSRIAYADDLPGDSWGSLFLVQPDGSDVLQLTSDTGDSEVTWSPDATRLATIRFGDLVVLELGLVDGVLSVVGSTTYAVPPYAAFPKWGQVSDQIVFNAKLSLTAWADVYMLDLGSGVVTNLTNDPNMYFQAPAFSPDDTSIVMTAASTNGWSTIHVMDADGGNLQNLGGKGKPGKGPHHFPSWH